MLAALGLLVAYLLALAIAGFLAWQAAQSLARQGQALAADPAQASARFEDLAASVRQLRDSTGFLRVATIPVRPLAAMGGLIPRVGRDVEGLPRMLDIGATAADAGGHALEGVRPVLAGGARLTPTGIATGLNAGRPEFQRALLITDGLHPLPGGQPLEEGASLADRAERAATVLQAALRLAVAAPDLLGVTGDRTYLLLGQNNDELRATGGFISTAGTVTVRQAALQELDYGDSYRYQASGVRMGLQPPAPYQQYMLFGDWYFRDSNWWPDFPTSARQAEHFLQASTGEQVDGVMAFDQTFLQQVLQVLGPVDLPAYQERIDAANVIDLLDAYAHPPGYKEGDDPSQDTRKVLTEDRKGIITELARVLVQRIQTAPLGTLGAMARVASDAMAQKHLQLYLHDPAAQEALGALDLDGAVRPPADGDYLLAVETNVGYSKANRTVNRALDYAVTLTPQAPATARLRLTYTNLNTNPARHCSPTAIDFFTADDSCYMSWVRVYAPAGSRPTAVTGAASPLVWELDGSASVFAALLVLQPGESKTLEFNYQLPRSVLPVDGAYRLLYQKQPGDRSAPLAVSLQGEDGRPIGEFKAQVFQDTLIKLPVP